MLRTGIKKKLIIQGEYAPLQPIKSNNFTMLFLKTLLVLFISFISLLANAQTTPPPTEKKEHKKPEQPPARPIFNVDLSGNIDVPAADMAKRFGVNYRLGIAMKYKTAKNWIYGVKGELITGNKIREDSLMINLKTSQGGVVSQLGDVLNVGTFERGYMLGVEFGRIFPLLQMNKNSGVTSIFSAGFIQHKIKLFDKDNSFPQLRESYIKGYDRLSNGMYLENFTGYTYYSTNKLINFYAGLNVVWGYTKGRRDYLFDVARPDTQRRNDILLGFKLGWIVPIYKKVTEETYY